MSSSPSPQITTPFAVPVALARHPRAAQLNAELRSCLLGYEAKGAEHANPRATMRIGQGLFESRFDLFKWPDRCIQELREFCWQQVFAFVGQVNELPDADAKRLRGHADAWFHVTRGGGHFALHNHPMASWSGVYCVDTGYPAGTPPASGLLSFPHPLGGMSMYQDAGNNRLRLPYGLGNRDYRLEPGQLVLFPAWLMHQVTPYTGPGERITVAFNTWFTLG